MTNEIKQQIVQEIERNVDVFKRVSPIQFVIRCPICGDSQKNPKDAHCYIKCSYDPDEPLLYNCFKCNKGGRVNKKFLKLLGLKDDLVDKLDYQRYNKIGLYKTLNIADITTVPVVDSMQMKYIEHRLGPGFTLDDYDKFKIIWDMSAIYQVITNNRVKNTMPSNMFSISFLSDDKSSLLTRSFNSDKDGWRWRKVTMFPTEGKSFYLIRCTLDLFTNDTIYVNIAEGIFDILSAYKNFNDGDNSVFLATLGSNYVSGVDYIINKGIVGSNVVLKIYLDADVDINQIKNQLMKYKPYFKRILLFRNVKDKDIGVKIENIKLVEDKV